MSDIDYWIDSKDNSIDNNDNIDYYQTEIMVSLTLMMIMIIMAAYIYWLIADWLINLLIVIWLMMLLFNVLEVIQKNKETQPFSC